MREKFKEWSGCLFFIVLLIAFIAFIFISKDKSKKPKTEETVGKYVYIDLNNTLHARNTCISIGNKDLENPLGNKGVTRLRSKEVDDDLLLNTCARCVTDEIYDKLERNAKRNRRGYEYDE